MNLVGTMYKGEWKEMPDFSKLKPAQIEDENTGIVSPAQASLKDGFAMVWEAKFDAAEAALHCFLARVFADSTDFVFDGAKGEPYVESDPTGPLSFYGETKLIGEWAKLPRGMYIGECSGVATDKDDNVWVFNRSKHPVMKFDKNGKLLDAWENMPVAASHGIKIDPDGNVWTVDVFGHSVKKWTREGKLLMVIGNAYMTGQTIQLNGGMSFI